MKFYITKYNSQVDQLLPGRAKRRNQFLRVGDRTSEPVPCEFGVTQLAVYWDLCFVIHYLYLANHQLTSSLSLSMLIMPSTPMTLSYM